MYAQVCRLINFRANHVLNSVCKNGVCDTHMKKVFQTQVVSITTKKFKDKSIKKPAPFPYETKKFTLWRTLFDDTLSRFDENTKLIVVEGNIASGKSTLAKTLAEELDMHFIPEPTMDQLYILEPYGFDIRELDHLMPHSFKCCDVRTFYENPHHHNVPTFQMTMFRLRFEQYFDALTHLLNTGQGVVLERCVYSDFVFLEAMVKFGYLSKGVHKYYYQARGNSFHPLIRPHLVVYLDVPSDVLLDRIQKRNIPYEVNSKVLTREYLDAIEHFYKQVYLKQISEHAELLVYDWITYGDSEVVVEDIERIDFDKYDQYDLKLKDWRNTEKWHWNELRAIFGNEKESFLSNTFYPNWDITELQATAEDTLLYSNLLKEYVPELKYQKGYHKEVGDKYLFKTSINYRDLQRLRIPTYDA